MEMPMQSATTHSIAPVTYRYVNIVSPDTHRGRMTLENATLHTNGFSRPALFKNLVQIKPDLWTRSFYEQIDSSATLQWRVQTSAAPATMRSAEGVHDYNYVSGRVGTASDFLDDIFERKLDVYSYLGTISAGRNDPHEWGKIAFKRVRDEILREPWFDVAGWRATGHMFLGNSTQDFGEPRNGAVGSDWHMFTTLNVFVMIAGKKKWWSYPPAIGDQYRNYDKMFTNMSGREAAGAEFDGDLMILEPGDVLLNPPCEWHKVLNARGFTLGAAFRIIDTAYLSSLSAQKGRDLTKADPVTNEDVAHYLTSVSYASRHLNRAQMLLNDIEYYFLQRESDAATTR